MPTVPGTPLLDVVLDSWDRNNAILVNLLRAVPVEALDAKVAIGSPTIARMFTHMHYCRVLFVSEDVPEWGVQLPPEGWRNEKDPDVIAAWLTGSAAVVRDVVKDRIEKGLAMKVRYDHPLLFLQHMIWHEGYHHGQVKLALKVAGLEMDDEEIGPSTWDVWMDKAPGRLASRP